MDGPTSMQPHTKMCQMETHASTGGYVPQNSSIPRLASLASRVSCNAARSSLAGELAGLDLAACTISAHSFVITVPLYGIRLPQLLSVDPATLYTSPLFFVSLAPSHPLQVLSHYARGHGTSPYFSSAWKVGARVFRIERSHYCKSSLVCSSPLIFIKHSTIVKASDAPRVLHQGKPSRASPDRSPCLRLGFHGRLLVGNRRLLVRNRRLYR